MIAEKDMIVDTIISYQIYYDYRFIVLNIVVENFN